MSATALFPTFAEILHLAADNHLAPDAESCWGGGRRQYSCCAVWLALSVHPMTSRNGLVTIDGNAYHTRLATFLESMGVNAGSFREFLQFENVGRATPASQGARYLWLKWAALMAEEQGL